MTSAEARAIDEATIRAGTPGLVLMERAAAAVAREIAGVLARSPERALRIVVLAGTGNNGGDGFEVARLLARDPRWTAPHVLLLGRADRLAGDAALTYKRLVESGVAIVPAGDESSLAPLREATLIVDALFGTGLARPLEGLAALAAQLCARRSAFVLAVDLPSGLDGSTGV
ncbi:MAG: NAD(P)H-hydrate epimerase, partial [Thermoanaerobaculia bacterium]